jgi:hypothetical protein
MGLVTRSRSAGHLEVAESGPIWQLIIRSTPVRVLPGPLARRQGGVARDLRDLVSESTSASVEPDVAVSVAAATS